MTRTFYKKNQLLQLKGFCALIEEKTIQKAAKKIGTVHSNISLQIKALEKETNLKLFEKSGKNLIPTELALEFYQSAKKTITDLEDLFTVRAKTLQKKNENLVRIAGHSYAFSHLLPKYFKKLIEINPDVKFELHNVSRNEGLSLLEKDLVDFVVFPFLQQHYIDKKYDIVDFYKCDFHIFFAKGHPIEKNIKDKMIWADILQHDFCTLGKENITAQDANDYNFMSKFNLINGTWEIIKSLVEEGLTISGADISYVANNNIAILKTDLLPNYKFSACFKNNPNHTNKSIFFFKQEFTKKDVEINKS